MTEDDIRRTAEREMTQSVIECLGGRGMANEQLKKISGVDALRGHTRSHPEHEG